MCNESVRVGERPGGSKEDVDATLKPMNGRLIHLLMKRAQILAECLLAPRTA